MNEIRKRARYAGLLYLLMGLTAPFGLLYVPGRLMVSGDAAATADRIRASESLLRFGIASELIHQVIAVFLVLALYRLFKDVDVGYARLLVCLGALVSVPIMFVNVLNEIAALTIAGGAGVLSVFDRGQLDALAYLFMRLHSHGIVVTSVFWGLWLFPFGLLAIRSGFIPPVFGVLLLIAGASYLLSSFTTLVVPRFTPVVDPITEILAFSEIPIIFWLAIWGARRKPSAAPAG